MSGTRTQKINPTKLQRKAIVNNFHRKGTDRLVKNKWMKADQWERHINDAIPLVGASDALSLAGADLPLVGFIRINANYLPRAILLDQVLNIHDLGGKHNTGDIYHNKITSPVISSIYDLFQPKMSPTLSFSGMYRKSFIHRRNRTNSQ